MKLFRFFEMILKLLNGTEVVHSHFESLEMKKNSNLEERLHLKKLFGENN